MPGAAGGGLKAVIGSSLGAAALLASTPAPGAPLNYIMVGGEDGEVFALDRDSIRPMGRGRYAARFVFARISEAAELNTEDPSAVDIADVIVTCRPLGYELVHIGHYDSKGRLVREETKTPPEAGWLHEVTEGMSRVVCSQALQRKVPTRSFPSIEAFSKQVDAWFSPGQVLRDFPR